MTKTYLIRGLTDPRITQASLILFKIVCAARHHVALLTSVALLNLGPSPVAKVLDLKGRLRCRGCGARSGRRFGEMGASGCVSRGYPAMADAPEANEAIAARLKPVRSRPPRSRSIARATRARSRSRTPPF
jgi:hypothetical protein